MMIFRQIANQSREERNGPNDEREKERVSKANPYGDFGIYFWTYEELTSLTQTSKKRDCKYEFLI